MRTAKRMLAIGLIALVTVIGANAADGNDSVVQAEHICC